MARDTKAGREAASNSAMILPAQEWRDRVGAEPVGIREQAAMASANALYVQFRSRSKKPVPCCANGCSTTMLGLEGASTLGGFYLPTDAAGIPTTRGGVICTACIEKSAGDGFADPARLIDLEAIYGAPGLLAAARGEAGQAPAGLDIDKPAGRA
jgi:hypothetical protein